MADSEVIRLLRSFKADLLRQERAQMEAMAARWLNVERRLHGQMDALAMEMVGIKRDGGTVSPELLMTQQRYRELLTQLQQEMEPYSDYVERTITDRQRQLARLGIKHAERAITSQGVAGGFNRLPVEAVENLAGFAANGTPLNNLLMMTWPDAAIGLTQELVNGIALGRNPRQVARMMANGATGSLDRMMVIARTEQLRAYRTANLDSYRASGVVNGYKRLATHDSRVCAACLMDEGTFYTLDEEMPEHPQGRCTLVPVVDGMPEPKWKQGQAWFEEQEPQTQKDILGKGRYYAWQNGDFDLGELVTVKPNAVWGDSLQTTTLHDLLGGRAVAPIMPTPVAVQPMTFGKLPSVIGEVHPEILKVFQEEFELIARDYPFLRDYVKAFNFSAEAGGNSFGADFDLVNQEVRLGRAVAKLPLTEYQEQFAAGSGDYFVGNKQLKATVIHETGHAIDTYVKIGVGPFTPAQDSYLDDIGRLRSALPSPSGYAETNIQEWVAERFTHERLYGGDELQSVFRQYAPQVDESNLDFAPKPKKRKGK